MGRPKTSSLDRAAKAYRAVPAHRREAVRSTLVDAAKEVRAIEAWHRKAARRPGMSQPAMASHVAQAQRANNAARDLGKLLDLLAAVEDP